jgi:acyl-coenzyme A thioesterase PaaI-like protein
MVSILDMWKKMAPLPMGKKAFSLAFSQKAPYFATIRPTFQKVEPNHVELTFPKRRSVHNHIGTVHAIALCNGAEAAMGALAEVSIPRGKRWIPKGMDINYVAKADSDITIIAETDPEQWTGDDPDLHVRVRALTTSGVECFNGVIKLWVTEKPTKA